MPNSGSTFSRWWRWNCVFDGRANPARNLFLSNFIVENYTNPVWEKHGGIQTVANARSLVSIFIVLDYLEIQYLQKRLWPQTHSIRWVNVDLMDVWRSGGAICISSIHSPMKNVERWRTGIFNRQCISRMYIHSTTFSRMVDIWSVSVSKRLLFYWACFFQFLSYSFIHVFFLINSLSMFRQVATCMQTMSRSSQL